MGKLAPVSTLRGGGHKIYSNKMVAEGYRVSQKASSKMMAEGHWNSQRASQKETRTRRASAEGQGTREVKGDRQERGQGGEETEDAGAQRREDEGPGDSEVQGDRQERGQKGEGILDEGARRRAERNENSGGRSPMHMGVGGDRNQRTLQQTEVGCHWSGSESGGDTESGPREPEAGNGSEASGVPSDRKATGRSRKDGQAEADAETTQEGSDRGREEKREKRGRSDQTQEWKDFWQHTEKKERGK